MYYYELDKYFLKKAKFSKKIMSHVWFTASRWIGADEYAFAL